MSYSAAFLRWVVALGLFCLSLGAHAELEKHAFVVGNSLYQGSGWILNNPRNDAQDMAAVLKDIGYAVHNETAMLDLTQAQFNAELQAFSNKLPEESVAVVYFAGHGIGTYRENYLIPVNAQITHVDELASKAISMRNVLATLLSNNNKGFNIIFLDACRDTPLEGKPFNGLIKLNPVANRTFIGYAASEGETASDGTGRNGAFTSVLLKALQEYPGEAIDVLFRKVSGGVKANTANRQNPIADNTISEKMCLAECATQSQGRWWYAVLGAALVAILLGQSGDSSNSGDEDRFTINLTPPSQ